MSKARPKPSPGVERERMIRPTPQMSAGTSIGTVPGISGHSASPVQNLAFGSYCFFGFSVFGSVATYANTSATTCRSSARNAGIGSAA